MPCAHIPSSLNIRVLISHLVLVERLSGPLMCRLYGWAFDGEGLDRSDSVSPSKPKDNAPWKGLRHHRDLLPLN